MKLLCIDNNFPNFFMPHLNVGEVYTLEEVSKEFPDSYILQEIQQGVASDGLRWSYQSYHFAPLSDIDETELAKQREELKTA